MNPPLRGEIFLVEFDPARGHEIQKTRPALILQNNIGNQHSPTTIVAAITSTRTLSPIIIDVLPSRQNGLAVPSAIHLGQIRSIDRERLVKRLGTVESPKMLEVDVALKISLGLVDL